MNPNVKYAFTCDCKNILWVSRKDAGSRIECPACNASLTIPNLSKLLQLPAVDASPLGILLDKIHSEDSPFDGDCQICSTANSEVVLPVRLEYVSKEQLASAEDAVEIQSCILPCYLCYSCDKNLAKSMWLGLMQQLLGILVNSFWLLIAFVLAAVTAAILPFIGTGFVALVVWGLYQQLTKRKANPALLKHLDNICGLSRILQDASYYRLKPLKRVRTSGG